MKAKFAEKHVPELHYDSNTQHLFIVYGATYILLPPEPHTRPMRMLEVSAKPKWCCSQWENARLPFVSVSMVQLSLNSPIVSSAAIKSHGTN